MNEKDNIQERDDRESGASFSESVPSSRPTGRPFGRWIIIAALMIGSVGYVLFCQHRRMGDINYYRPLQGVEYTTTDGNRLVPLSVGYRLSLADYYWLRIIQAFGDMHGDKDYSALFNLFFIITDIDPRFVWVYRFGTLAMADEGRYAERAVDLLEKGLYSAPFTYRLPYEAAYTIMDRLPPTEANRHRALFFVEMALKRPDCPDHIVRFRDDILSKTGRHEIATSHSLRGMLEEADLGMRDNGILYSIYRRRLLASVYQWQQDQLGAEAQNFRARHGYDPRSVQELFDDNPAFFYKTLYVENVDALVEFYRNRGEKIAPKFDEIVRQSIDYTRDEPYDPRVLDDAARSKERVPYVTLRNRVSMDKQFFIQSRDEALEETRMAANRVRYALAQYYKAHGALPKEYEEALESGFIIRKEPLGGYWVYDPSAFSPKEDDISNSVFHSSERPDL